MGIIRWFLDLFNKGENNKIMENLEEWDRNFEKGKLKKGRRFRQIVCKYIINYYGENMIVVVKIA